MAATAMEGYSTRPAHSRTKDDGRTNDDGDDAGGGVVIKLQFPCGELRRSRVPPGTTLSMAWLHERVARVVAAWGAVSLSGGSGTAAAQATAAKLKYRDEEGDWITLASGADVAEAIVVARESCRPMLRVMVLGVPATTRASWQACRRLRGVSDDGGAHSGRCVHAAPAAVVPAPAPPAPTEATWVARVVPTAGGSRVVRVSRGTRVVMKTFRLKNEGTAQWPVGVRLVHVGGELMGAPAAGVPVSRAVPGEVVTVRLTLLVPLDAGTHSSEWRLSAPAAVGGSGSAVGGVKFGHRVWVDVEVAGTEVQRGACVALH